jgi:hypothetical protein
MLTQAHKSDFIRAALLAYQGGIWADSTTFCWLPLNDGLATETQTVGGFVFRQPKERNDRQITNWCIASSRNNVITSMMFNTLCDYLFNPREVWLTMRKPRHYDHYENISGTGYTSLGTWSARTATPISFIITCFLATSYPMMRPGRSGNGSPRKKQSCQG